MGITKQWSEHNLQRVIHHIFLFLFFFIYKSYNLYTKDDTSHINQRMINLILYFIYKSYIQKKTLYLIYMCVIHHINQIGHIFSKKNQLIFPPTTTTIIGREEIEIGHSMIHKKDYLPKKKKKKNPKSSTSINIKRMIIY